MKTLLLIIALIASLSASVHQNKNMEYAEKQATYMKELDSLSPKQKAVLIQSFRTGAKHNLGYTLASMGWKESDFGQNKINMRDGSHTAYPGSFGTFQQMLSEAMKLPEIKHKYTASQVKYRLLYDDKFASEIALNHLSMWKAHWESKHVSNTYKYMVASYNCGGYGARSTKGNCYAEDIALRTKVLKDWGRKEGIYFDRLV
jgi:hypothetical protein